jgi:hypothetical protein
MKARTAEDIVTSIHIQCEPFHIPGILKAIELDVKDDEVKILIQPKGLTTLFGVALDKQ